MAIKVIKASAGSGKTYSLSKEFIAKLVEGTEGGFRSILAVTFTKDATGEIKQRILEDLFAIKNDQKPAFVADIIAFLQKKGITKTPAEVKFTATRALHEILHDYGRFYVYTIDGFFQKVLRNLARELGKGSRFNIELNVERTINEGVRDLIRTADRNTLKFIEDFITNQIESDKSWNVRVNLEELGRQIYNEFYQKRSVELTARVKANPTLFKDKIGKYNRIVTTYERELRQKAKEFFAEIDKRGIEQEDFAGRSRAYVPGYYRKLLNGKFTFTDGLVNVQRAIADSSKLFPGRRDAEASAFFHQHLSDTEEFRQNGMKEYNSASLCLKNIYSLKLLSDISQKIEERSLQSNRFILSDTQQVLNSMINEELDAQFIYEKIGASVDSVMIDEFQDTSRLQWENFCAMLSNIGYGLLVGDVKQSIYRWRNGDWRILNNIEGDQRLMPTVESLGTNYRSSHHVVEFNNDIFPAMASRLADRIEGKLKESDKKLERNPFQTAYSPEAVQQKPKQTDLYGYVEVQFIDDTTATDNDSDDETTEPKSNLDALIDVLKRLHARHYPAEKIAILCRKNDEIQRVARAIRNGLEGEEYADYLDLVSAEAFMLGLSEVLKSLMACFRLIANPSDSIALRELEEMQRAELTAWFTEGKLEELRGKTLYQTAVEILKVANQEELQSQSGYIFAFLENLLKFQTEKSPSLSQFIAYWEEELAFATVMGDSKGIRMMTTHKSKGLEFGTVILPFATSQMDDVSRNTVWCEAKEAPFDLPIFPINANSSMKESHYSQEYIEEIVMQTMDELNVFYVACTRAKNNLFIISKTPSKNSLDDDKNEKSSIRLEELLFVALDGQIESKEQQTFTRGEFVDYKEEASGAKTDNPFAKGFEQESLTCDFGLNTSKEIFGRFRQSNDSYRFVFSDDDEADVETTYNEFLREGNLMHDIFSSIATRGDAERAVQRGVAKGVIPLAKQQEYLDKTNGYLDQLEGSYDWFSGRYRLLAERTILSSGERDYRPDRVMIDREGSGKAIVVDYKFGNKSDSYNRQVRNYVSLLQDMGYEVEGYLWYAGLGEVEQVQ